jgi:hypothetical protein
MSESTATRLRDQQNAWLILTTVTVCDGVGDSVIESLSDIASRRSGCSRRGIVAVDSGWGGD